MVGRIVSRRVSLLFHAPRFIKSNLKNLIRVYSVPCAVHNVHTVLYRIGDEDNWDMYASNWTLPLQWSLEIGIYIIHFILYTFMQANLYRILTVALNLFSFHALSTLTKYKDILFFSWEGSTGRIHYKCPGICFNHISDQYIQEPRNLNSIIYFVEVAQSGVFMLGFY